MGSATASAMPWETLELRILEEYYHKSVKQDLGNLVVKGNAIETFQNFLPCAQDMATPEHKKGERYIWV